MPSVYSINDFVHHTICSVDRIPCQTGYICDAVSETCSPCSVACSDLGLYHSNVIRCEKFCPRKFDVTSYGNSTIKLLCDIFLSPLLKFSDENYMYVIYFCRHYFTSTLYSGTQFVQCILEFSDENKVIGHWDS